MQTVVIGKRGTIVIPAKLRKRYRLDEGSPLLVEERDGGFFMRPAVAWLRWKFTPRSGWRSFS